jgi:hypothetical protein
LVSKYKILMAPSQQNDLRFMIGHYIVICIPLKVLYHRKTRSIPSILFTLLSGSQLFNFFLLLNDDIIDGGFPTTKFSIKEIDNKYEMYPFTLINYWFSIFFTKKKSYWFSMCTKLIYIVYLSSISIAAHVSPSKFSTNFRLFFF